MSDKKPVYPAIVYQNKIQILEKGEALIRAGKARCATAKDAAIAGVSVDKAALAAGDALQKTLDAEATSATSAAAAKAKTKKS